MAGAHGGGGSERWLVTYADMLTLLLALFIILYSISKADVQKFRRFQEGMQQAFHVDVLQGRDAPALKSSGAIVAQDASTTIAPVVKPTSVPSAVWGDAATARRLQEAFQGITMPGARGGVTVETRPNGLVISIYGVLLFDSDQTNLLPAGRQALSEIAAEIRPLPYDVRVEGNTDSIQPTGGPYPTNWELSTARALVVTHYLIDVAKFQPSRISAEGNAEFRPVASNATRAGRLRNRRVDLVLTHPHPFAKGNP